MKPSQLISLAALSAFFATGCDRQSNEIDRKLAALEERNAQALERQRELEQELEDQRLAVERDAIERERAQIEEQRTALAQATEAASEAQNLEIRNREEALARREGQLEQQQANLGNLESNLETQKYELSAKERELAGREAIAMEVVEQRLPVGDYGMFYDSLSSYGSWFETSDYGYVWQPVVVRDRDWRPYSRGRWACSDRGWTWVSEEPFGWATYHYGRWTLLRGRGWVWVPGSEWAPSWVSWRESGTHIGWAPLPPETLAYREHSWNSRVDEQFGIAPTWFNFVEIQYFGGPIYNHRVPITTNITVIQNTVNITHIHVQNRQVISGGPRYQKMSERLGRPLPYYKIQMDRQLKGTRDAVSMRPRIQGDRMVVAAPNMDAAWNSGLKPKQIKGKIESVEVERKTPIAPEFAERFREKRSEDRQKAEQSIAELGGREKFEQARTQKLQENRQKLAIEMPEKSPRNREKKVQAAQEIPQASDRIRQEIADKVTQIDPAPKSETQDRKRKELRPDPQDRPPGSMRPSPQEAKPESPKQQQTAIENAPQNLPEATPIEPAIEQPQIKPEEPSKRRDQRKELNQRPEREEPKAKVNPFQKPKISEPTSDDVDQTRKLEIKRQQQMAEKEQARRIQQEAQEGQQLEIKRQQQTAEREQARRAQQEAQERQQEQLRRQQQQETEIRRQRDEQRSRQADESRRQNDMQRQRQRDPRQDEERGRKFSE